MTDNEQYDYNGSSDLPVGVDPVQTPHDKVKAKLYRDTDDVMIGGVCSGLSYRFHMSVILMRAIAFVVTLLVPHIVVVAYICVWLIVPKAITVAQKLEMRGLPPDPQTVQNFLSYEPQQGCLYSVISVFLKLCIFVCLIAATVCLFKYLLPV